MYAYQLNVTFDVNPDSLVRALLYVNLDAMFPVLRLYKLNKVVY